MMLLMSMELEATWPKILVNLMNDAVAVATG